MAYMAQFDQLDLDLDFTPYDDPPPPYSPPKTPRVPMGEAPPPYEETQPSENNNTDAAGDVPSLSTGQNGSVRSMAESNSEAVLQDGTYQARLDGLRRSSSETSGPVEEATVDENRYPDYSASTESRRPSPLNSDISHVSLVDGNESSHVQPEHASSNVANPTRPRVARQSSDADGKYAMTDNIECPGSGFHGADGCNNRRSSGVPVFSAREIEHAANNLHSHRSSPPTDQVLSERNHAKRVADNTACRRVAQAEGTKEFSFPTSGSEGSYHSEGACGGGDIHPYQSTEPSLGHRSTAATDARGRKVGPRRPRCGIDSRQPVVALPSHEASICHSPVFVRSSSVASQISVCSETGEQRQHGTQTSDSGMPFARVHNFDSPPAEARITAKNSSEERCAGSRLACHDLCLKRDSHTEDHVDNRFDVWQKRQCGTDRLDSNIRVDTQTGQHACLDEHAYANIKPCKQKGNIAAHTQFNGDDTDNKHACSVDSNSSFHNVGESSRRDKDTKPSGGSPSQVCVDGSRRAKRSSGIASPPQILDQVSPERGCQHEKTTLRQLKKKKRRPHSSPGQSADVVTTRSTNDIVNYQRLDNDKKSTPSPGRAAHRRNQKQQPDNPAMYKQYGFIDTSQSSRPHVVNGDISKSLSLCKLQDSDDAANANVDGCEGKVQKRCRETSKERDSTSFNHDGSGSRRPKRCSRPASYLN